MINEKIVETKKCKQCNCSFDITDIDLVFYNKISPIFAGEKFQIPTPAFCSDCRQQRRLSCRNERKLYTRKCDKTNKTIISIFSPDKKYKVYSHEYWWGDDWDALDYGTHFNFNISFFENFKKLDLLVPKLSTTIQNSENCEYTNDTGDSNDCYLSYRTHYSSKINYCYRANKSTNCVDCYQVKESENLYECFQCNKCQNSRYLYNCENTHTSYFLYNCTGTKNCFLSYNLVNASYIFLNKVYSKEEYDKKVSEILNDDKKFREAKEYFFNMIECDIHFLNLNNINTEDSLGNELIECKDCINCFMMKGCESCKYSWDNVNYKNSMDTYSGGGSEYSYETLATKNSYKNSFTHRIKESKNLLYCMFCFFSDDCFGCIGLRNKQYCILNKQYTKEEYENMVPKIIKHMKNTGEWGEFFPSSISPFGYNETVAYEYFPLTKEKALNLGFNWSDYEAPFPKVGKIIPANKLPASINDIPDDILNWAIECEVTKKPFRIIVSELEFYRKNNIGIPRRHPDQRHYDRLKQRNSRKLYKRKCDKCFDDILTTYLPDTKKVIYCEKCYSKEVN
ncbi:MAG: hypothetical protein QM490_04875 [Candidatus Gracilibacteria bacterium]